VHKQLDAFLAETEPFDAVVVTDARSFPAAQHVVEKIEAAAGTPPQIAFRADQLPPPVTSGGKAP
jgi:hypothetical protein